MTAMETRPQRTLRLRANAFRTALSAAREEDEMLVPTRQSLEEGAPVNIEISFGPLADEITLTATIVEAGRSTERPSTKVRLDDGQRAKLSYVGAVLDGGREAAARRHRRIPSNIPVNWRQQDSVHSSRLRDISVGGAFILSEDPPHVGQEIDVILRPGAALPRVEVSSVVSWVARTDDFVGFGVNFKPSDPAVAQRLGEVVRHHESDAVLA
jgi:hypothetical protein